MVRSWARRSFDAETIFMALVICRVFFTLRMRLRRSRTFAIAIRYFAAAATGCLLLRLSRKFFLVLVRMASARTVFLIEFVVERLLCFVLMPKVRIVRVRGFEERIVAVFKGAEVFDFDIVEETVDSGIEDGYLLLKRERLELRLL